MKANVVCGFLLLILVMAVPAAGKDIRATVVYDDVASEVNTAQLGNHSELWVTTADLTHATGFELKPQGVCRQELCFPVPKARAAEFVREETGKTWFNLTSFADLVRQPVAVDSALSAWYFGLRVDQQKRLESLRAPDFTLPDLQGKMHSLSDFRGKKVFLVTWASW